MLNVIWAFMILTGIVYALFTGNMQAVSDEILNASGDAVELCITMLGILGFWCGTMEVAKAEGIIDAMTRWLRPAIRWMFPSVPEDDPAMAPISMNMIANILGLGWAATPAGLEAMEQLARRMVEDKKQGKKVDLGTASDAMCTFLVLNISSLQLIPVSIIAYRRQYGSTNPSAVIVPGLLATAVSTLVAIIFCKLRYNRRFTNTN